MAYTHRGDIPTEEMKERAMQRLYQLLPNHKCPQKDCPFHPPEEEEKEEEELDTEILIKNEQNGGAVDEVGGLLMPPSPPPEEEIEEEGLYTGDDSAASDYESTMTVDSGVGRERDEFSDAGDVVLTFVSPDLQRIQEDDDDADDESATPVVLAYPKKEDVTDASEEPDLPHPVETDRPKHKLQVAPEFTAKLKSRRVPEGLSLHLNCSVTGIPEPHVLWFKDGQQISNGPDYYIRNNYGLLSLEVASVSRQHAGVYSCEASNDVGKVTCDATIEIEDEEEVKTIQVEILRPRFVTPLQDVVASEGQDVTFHCKATGKPLPDFRWQKDMLELRTSSRVEVTSENMGESTLTIRNVSFSDAGLYIVRAKSKSGRCQSTATLRVLDDTSPPDRSRLRRSSSQIEIPPSFTIRLPSCLDVHEGERLKLDCSVQGYPAPIVTWYKGHRGLMYGPRHRIMFVGSLHTLEIPQTMALDSGDYIVRAVNSSGSVRSSCFVHLLPPRRGGAIKDQPVETDATTRIKTGRMKDLSGEAPLFTKPLPDTMEVSEGDSCRLDCILRDGIQLVPWSSDEDAGQTKDASRVSNRQPEGSSRQAANESIVSQNSDRPFALHHISQVLHRMVIPRSMPHSPRTIPMRRRGPKVRASITLHFLQPLQSEAKAKLGDNVTLSCTVSQPFTRITWFKNDRRLSFQSQRLSSVTEEGGRVSLQLREIVESDAGRYRCEATVSDGSQIETTTQLIVDGKPNPPSHTKVVDVTHNSVTLSWLPPRHNSGSIVLAYTVELSSPSDPKTWTVVTHCCQGNTYQVRNLSPNSQYLFRVRAENIHGVSKGSRPSAVILTKMADMGPQRRSVPCQQTKPRNVPRHSINLHLEGTVTALLNHTDIQVQASPIKETRSSNRETRGFNTENSDSKKDLSKDTDNSDEEIKVRTQFGTSTGDLRTMCNTPKLDKNTRKTRSQLLQREGTVYSTPPTPKKRPTGPILLPGTRTNSLLKLRNYQTLPNPRTQNGYSSNSTDTKEQRWKRRLDSHSFSSLSVNKEDVDGDDKSKNESNFGDDSISEKADGGLETDRAEGDNTVVSKVEVETVTSDPTSQCEPEIPDSPILPDSPSWRLAHIHITAPAINDVGRADFRTLRNLLNSDDVIVKCASSMSELRETGQDTDDCFRKENVAN